MSTKPINIFSKLRLHPLTLSFLLFIQVFAKAQNNNITLSGKVFDAQTKHPLSGATVHIKGTTHQVITDEKGEFHFLTGQRLPVTYSVTYIGYKTMELTQTQDGHFELPLQQSNTQLNDVVVVGYGTQQRRSLIGSVSKINPTEAKNIPVASFDAQLQGQASGVQINTFSGLPGEGVRVQVRGTSSINSSNDPLYVIDGLFVNNNTLSSINLGSKFTSPLADINPADFESIEVLKDASAIAIYGSRGANGVVLVTTKRGDFSASKPRFNVNIYQGWQKADPNRIWKLTTGPEHAALVNEAYTNSGIENPNQTKYTYNNRPFQPNVSGIADPFAPTNRGNPEDQATYDRLSRVFRTASVRNIDFNVQGGSKSIRYYFGTGYTEQEGILKPYEFNRGSFKLNLDVKLSEKVTLGSSNSVYRSFRQQVRGGAGQEAGHLLAALHHPTYFPLTYLDGTPSRGSIYESIDNLINTDISDISTISLRYLGTQFLEAAILPGLKFKTSFGIDYNNYNEQEYFNDQTQIGGVLNPGGYKNEAITNYSVFLNEQTLNYKKAIGAHNISALVGNTLQISKLQFNSLTGSGFPNNSYKEISAASNRTSSQNETKSKLASFFGRVGYDYQNTYFLEATVRADASSRFGANNRWGYFPGIGAAWRVKESALFRNIEVISDLKLRVSAGSAGNQNGIGDFAARGLWTGNAQYPDNLTSGDRPGTAPSQLENPDLKWEKTATYNIGLDASLYNDRIQLGLNGYYKYTTDALLFKPIPTATGYTSVLSNAGEISNRGIEIDLTTNNIVKSDFNWTSSINFASNINRAEKLISPITFEAREYIRTEEGAQLGSYWLYKQLYVDPATGDAVFDDVNKDGKLTAADRQLLGNLIPKFFGGITNNFSYKGLDLNVLFTYQYGNKIYNFNRFIMEGGGTRDASRAILKSQLKRWQKPGDITDVPRLTFFGNNYTIEQNSRFLEDASFLRLKAITLGYTLPATIISKVGLNKVRLYAMGTNLWILTKYTGADPESSGSALQNRQGLDTATPPQPMGIQFGVNISF